MLTINDILLRKHKGAKITSKYDYFDLFKQMKDENKCVGIIIPDTVFTD